MKSTAIETGRPLHNDNWSLNVLALCKMLILPCQKCFSHLVASRVTQKLWPSTVFCGSHHDELQLTFSASISLAGSDTTATSLRVATLYISTNPVVRDKLLAELDEADRTGHFSTPTKYDQLKTLPYLTAVIKETIRM